MQILQNLSESINQYRVTLNIGIKIKEAAFWNKNTQKNENRRLFYCLFIYSYVVFEEAYAPPAAPFSTENIIIKKKKKKLVWENQFGTQSKIPVFRKLHCCIWRDFKMNKIKSPIFVLLCVLCSQRPHFRVLLQLKYRSYICISLKASLSGHLHRLILVVIVCTYHTWCTFLLILLFKHDFAAYKSPYFSPGFQIWHYHILWTGRCCCCCADF